VLDTLLPMGVTTFNSMFQPPWQGHVASPVLSYQGLCQALTKPGLDTFGRSGTAEQNKREVAAFLAQVAKETAYLEKPVQDGAVAGSTEWGRGAMQLTHSYNYEAAGAFLGMDLVRNPDVVGRDPVLAWSTGLWFWMKYHQNAGGTDPTCHDLIMMGSFGETTRKINAISCGNSDATTRAGIYQTNCTKLGVTPGGVTTC
jgi:chitinase